jgi:hypothetical protein
MEWIIASLVSSFVLGIIVGYFFAKHHFLNEQMARDASEKNNRMWVEYLRTLQGGHNE